MGIEDFDGMFCTYRHLAGRTLPVSSAEMYRFEVFTEDVAPTPIHVMVYYVPGDRVDDFLSDFGERGNRVIDIRSITSTEARAEIETVRTKMNESAGCIDQDDHRITDLQDTVRRLETLVLELTAKLNGASSHE